MFVIPYILNFYHSSYDDIDNQYLDESEAF